MVKEDPLAQAEMPGAVRLYLNRAAPRNARLRAELHANLHQRMLDHLTAGLASEAAWEAALHDFGPVESRWPRTIRTLLALSALGTVAFATAARMHLGLL